MAGSHHCICCRAARACISQNGSYSRQTELRLLEALYPAGEGGCCIGSGGGARDQQSGHDSESWSSDEEDTGKTAKVLPHIGESSSQQTTCKTILLVLQILHDT